MDNLTQKINRHYLKDELLEDIIRRLAEQNINLEKVSRKDIAGVDEFHVRGAAVSKELAKEAGLSAKKVLDVGCGLGGPCRMLADEFNCDVTGIDLCQEYIRTAKGLSKLVKLEHKTTFLHGNALDLPFSDGAFDTVWTQHVQMNIPDKDRFYSEIHRVLKPGGCFLYYDLFCTNDQPITYPMPWVNSKEVSFLVKKEDIQSILKNLHFVKISTKDQTQKGIEFFEKLMPKMKQANTPNLGLNVLMGASTKPKLLNLFSHLQQNLLSLESGIFQKPLRAS